MRARRAQATQDRAGRAAGAAPSGPKRTRPRCRRLANAAPESVESMLLCVRCPGRGWCTPSGQLGATSREGGREGSDATHRVAISLAYETPLWGRGRDEDGECEDEEGREGLEGDLLEGGRVGASE